MLPPHKERMDERVAMVREQIISRGVRDEVVLRALEDVPRHCFVPEDLAGEAYRDRPLPIGKGQTISQPYMVAIMTSLLNLGPEDRVLEIGTGSGYQAAVLAQIVRQVVTIERIEPIAEQARRRLESLGVANATVHVGDGTLGWPSEAPYNGIIVTAGGPSVPQTLLEQLADGGRLVCPVGEYRSQRLVIQTRHGNGFTPEYGISCVFVPLIGKHGWPES